MLFLENTIHAVLPASLLPLPEPAHAEDPEEIARPRAAADASASPPRRDAAATAERKLRILERLTAGVSAAHTMTMEGDLQAMDWVIRFAGELDRYHGYGRAEIAAAPQPRLVAPARELLLAKPAPEAREAEIFRSAKP